MKVFAWVITSIIYGVVATSLKYCGITLGGTPTIILLCAIYFVSKKLAEKWHEHKIMHNHKKTASAFTEPLQLATKKEETKIVEEHKPKVKVNRISAEVLTSKTEPADRPKEKKRFVVPFVFCSLLAVLAIAAAAWLFQQSVSAKETVLELEKTILQLEQDKAVLEESLSEAQATAISKEQQCSGLQALLSSTKTELSTAKKDADYLRFEVLHNVGFYLGGNIYHRYSCDKIADFSDVFCAPVSFFVEKNYEKCSCWNLSNWQYSTYLRRKQLEKTGE